MYVTGRANMYDRKCIGSVYKVAAIRLFSQELMPW
jgi:hypothetical protein